MYRSSHSRDVYDFYKPNHSEYAEVDGRLSQVRGCDNEIVASVVGGACIVNVTVGGQMYAIKAPILRAKRDRMSHMTSRRIPRASQVHALQCSLVTLAPPDADFPSSSTIQPNDNCGGYTTLFFSCVW